MRLGRLQRKMWVKITFWTLWALSVYFALAELAVRKVFGYHSDNTFYWMALLSVVLSGFFLAEMVRPGILDKCVKMNIGDVKQ
jgi:hypothetical protein